jgi:hypothetical protein
VELGENRSPQDYINAIKSDINPANCKMVVVILFNPSLKPKIKSFLD